MLLYNKLLTLQQDNTMKNQQKQNWFDILMSDSFQTKAFIVLVVLIAMYAMFHVGRFYEHQEHDAAIKFWTSVEDICNVSGKQPKLESTKLPNGNAGFYITCEAK